MTNKMLKFTDLSKETPFKEDSKTRISNFNEIYKEFINDKGVENIPVIMLTITNNTGGGQAVSMANIKATSNLAKKYKIPFYLDACRFAENAYFIKKNESGFKDHSILSIVKEMFSYADGCTMSAKKDAIANIGGFLCTNDDSLAKKKKDLLSVQTPSGEKNFEIIEVKYN